MWYFGARNDCLPHQVYKKNKKDTIFYIKQMFAIPTSSDKSKDRDEYLKKYLYASFSFEIKEDELHLYIQLANKEQEVQIFVSQFTNGLDVSPHSQEYIRMNSVFDVYSKDGIKLESNIELFKQTFKNSKIFDNLKFKTYPNFFKLNNKRFFIDYEIKFQNKKVEQYAITENENCGYEIYSYYKKSKDPISTLNLEFILKRIKN